MKNAKKFAGFLLALVMLLSLSVSAFAAGSGTVTISGALKGNTFTLYKIFDLESYDPTSGTYAYTIRNDSPLYDTIKTMQLPHGEPAELKNVFALTSKDNAVDYVQLTVNFSNIQEDGSEIKAIASQLMEAIKGLSNEDKAKLSMKQIDHLGETEQTTVPAVGSGITTAPVAGDENKYDITFSNLDLGYYLVDSSAGTMIGLTTTNPDATITAKNELPVVVKEVKRNVNDKWSDSNSKVIGETVNYRVQVGVKPGATNYVIYDSLSEGLTFDKITKVYYGYGNNPDDAHVIYDASETTPIDDPSIIENFVYTKAAEGAPITHNGKNCCFKMKFTDKFLDQVLKEDGTSGYVSTIFVEYDAKLNEKAVIAGAGNPNDIYLTYGKNDVEVAHDTVNTYTYEMELVKTKDDNDKTVLNGAEFEVYTQRTLTTTAAVGLDQTETLTGQLSFIETTDADTGKTVYRVATQEEIDNPAVTTVTVIKAGDVIIRGLGGNFETATGASGRTYYFKEIKAPEGYTLIPSATSFTIQNSDQLARVEAGKWISGGLKIENRSGSLLPSTGGMGTTIFYMAGAILLVGAGVLLVTKKRMSVVKESR